MARGSEDGDKQDAVDAASDGDTIYVCEGVYTFVEIDRATLSLVGAGTGATTVDGGAHPAITVDSSTIDSSGFTLTGANTTDFEVGGRWIIASTAVVEDVRFADSASGYAAFQRGSAVTWDGVVFEDNTAAPLAAADGGSMVLRHSIFRNNQAPSSGGAVYLTTPLSSGWVYNNTWHANDHGGAQYLVYSASSVRFEDNIVSETVGGGIAAHEVGDGMVYNTSSGNTGDNWPSFAGDATPAENLIVEPRFTDAAGGDFTLLEGFSPWFDAGNPLSGYDDVDGTRNDLGRFGGPAGSW